MLLFFVQDCLISSLKGVFGFFKSGMDEVLSQCINYTRWQSQCPQFRDTDVLVKEILFQTLLNITVTQESCIIYQAEPYLCQKA